MENQTINGLNTNRRDFLIKSLPACALSCVGLSCFGATNEKMNLEENINEPEHKFDSEFKRTYRQAYLWKYNSYIGMMKEMSKLLGEEKLIELIKKSVENRNMRGAKDGSEFSLFKWADSLEKSQGFKTTNTIKFPIKTESKVEVEITECLWAETFKKRKAGNIGFATVCYGDYSLFRAMHPKLNFEREKTLMQGHDCCNGILTLEA